MKLFGRKKDDGSSEGFVVCDTEDGVTSPLTGSWIYPTKGAAEEQAALSNRIASQAGFTPTYHTHRRGNLSPGDRCPSTW
jgi:hypothetical protein